MVKNVAKAEAVMTIANEMIDKELGAAAVVVAAEVAVVNDDDDDGDDDDEGLKKKKGVVDDYNRNTAGTHNRRTVAGADHSTLHTQIVVAMGNSHNRIAASAAHTAENNTPHRKVHQNSIVADPQDSSKKW